ncbi:MAG: hypothetical protein ACE5I7_13175 [Candidatus Binatia bacterium]
MWRSDPILRQRAHRNAKSACYFALTNRENPQGGLGLCAGNGITEQGEQCDDGNRFSVDGLRTGFLR